jgi:hypothetical protein
VNREPPIRVERDASGSHVPVADQGMGAARKIAALALVAVACTAFLVLFERLTIQGTSLGIDWYSIWSGMNRGRPLYGEWMVTPPWIILLILPLAFMSFRASWGIILLLTMGAVILSIPRTRNRAAFMLMALLVGTSFSHLRHAADGNLEGLVILGVLAILWAVDRADPFALAAGVFLASAKIQVTWLLLIYISAYVLAHWPRRRWLSSAGLVTASIGIGLLWRGRDWLQTLWVVRERSQPVDLSLWATIHRLGLPLWLAVIFAVVILVLSLVATRTGKWAATRSKAGVLISASLLVAPYAAGNSLLSALAIGGAPFLLASPPIGIAMFLLDDLKYLSPNTWMVAWGATFATGQVFLLWAVMLWWIRRQARVERTQAIDHQGVDRGESRNET